MPFQSVIINHGKDRTQFTKPCKTVMVSLKVSAIKTNRRRTKDEDILVIVVVLFYILFRLQLLQLVACWILK